MALGYALLLRYEAYLVATKTKVSLVIKMPTATHIRAPIQVQYSYISILLYEFKNSHRHLGSSHANPAKAAPNSQQARARVSSNIVK